MKIIKYLILLIVGMLYIHPVEAQLQMGDNLPEFTLMSNTDSTVKEHGAKISQLSTLEMCKAYGKDHA